MQASHHHTPTVPATTVPSPRSAILNLSIRRGPAVHSKGSQPPAPSTSETNTRACSCLGYATSLECC